MRFRQAAYDESGNGRIDQPGEHEEGDERAQIITIRPVERRPFAIRHLSLAFVRLHATRRAVLDCDSCLGSRLFYLTPRSQKLFPDLRNLLRVAAGMHGHQEQHFVTIHRSFNQRMDGEPVVEFSAEFVYEPERFPSFRPEILQRVSDSV